MSEAREHLTDPVPVQQVMDEPSEVHDLITEAVRRALTLAPSPDELPADTRARLRTLLAGPVQSPRN